MIFLLLYIHDALLLHRIHDNATRSAYTAAQLLQNVSVNRSDKRLTQKDLKQITYASSMNFFTGKSVFKPYPLGYYYEIYYEYAKRINENQYNYYAMCLTTNPKIYGGSLAPTSPNTYAVHNPGTSGTKTSEQVKSVTPRLLSDKDNGERLRIRCKYVQTGSNSLLWILPKKTIQKIVILTPKNGIFPVK